MANIIAGGFDAHVDAEAALARLEQSGVRPENVCSFRVNPPGEHHNLPAGGDRDKSPGAVNAQKGAGKGAAIGGAIGAAAGAAATPLMGPAGIVAGAAAGAYTGSLVGGLKRMDNEPQPGHAQVRPAETLIAVNVDADGPAMEEVIRLFEECGARQVERTEGRWENGEWADFDPLTPPQLIGGRDRYESQRGAPPR